MTDFRSLERGNWHLLCKE